ncbi:VWA domain-containing protein [Roseiconus lacunae]|uniref:VWA domain-containing protein n=1 Tax=Roseiconus lacunae TaxID=2605694 RepID=A0ABT7PBY0_9BACT|nr:VWA domain-containing protein [Roseiconus lacunae]MDM4013993.1 VWA domain-containing protein [Roseiconus lacunae]
MDVEFRTPAFLLLLLLLPVIYMMAVATPSVLRFSSLRIPDQGAKSIRLWLSKLPGILLTIAFACFIVALSGPQTPNAESRVSREGIAIMMVVDRSGSMKARDLVEGDYSVDRLQVVKDVFRQFVLGDDDSGTDGRDDDAIGLVAFAGFADSLCPLTLDHGNLVSMVNDLQIAQTRREDGTAIGDALALAVERLRQSETKSKVAILLTDGSNNAGIIAPRQAADVAQASGVKVYCIGTGTRGRAPFPTIDPFTGRAVLTEIEVELDEDTLKMIADKTQGQYFRATDRDGLLAVYKEIDAMERTKVTEQRYLQYDQWYRVPLLVGLVLMAVSLVSKATVFRSLP